MTETASDFIARKSAEWERECARGKLIRMKDVNREAVHVYRRDAWTSWCRTPTPRQSTCWNA